MKLGGVSICGSYHEVNQDRFFVREIEGGTILAVSDGLGSRKSSQAGSAALCQAVSKTVENFSVENFDHEKFLSAIHSSWLKILLDSNLKIEDCNATALIGLKRFNEVRLFRLGDGFITAAFDDSAISLFDAKEDEFANITDCLTADFDFELWECRRVEFKNFVGMIAGTDGVTFEIEEENLNKFVAEFCKSYADDELVEILADIKSWLPKLSGVDDKTLAFVIEGENFGGNNFLH